MRDRHLTSALHLAEQLRPALERDDRAKLTELVGQLIAIRAPMGRQWLSLARLAAGIGELGQCREALDLYVAGTGGDPAAQYQKIALLAELGAWDEAYEVLCTLPDTIPDPIANIYSRGTALLNLGRAEEAREHLERVVDARPSLGSPWLVLAMSSDLARAPELAERIIAAEPALEDAAPAERAPYYYALGKAHAERGEHAAAFAAFARGAQEMKSLLRYDADADRLEADEAVRGYSAERLAAIAQR